MRARAALTIAAVLVAGCSHQADAGRAEDASKLSLELEAKARDIERRADAAAAGAERDANAQLAELNREAAAQPAGDAAQAPADTAAK